jgi:ATP-dependent DNA helicase 2 subunit 2
MKGTIFFLNRLLYSNDLFRNPAEYVQPDDAYSPVLHRINQVVGWRAVHPHGVIPPPAEILTRFSHPPKKLVTNSKAELDSLIAAADVKKGMSRYAQCSSPVPSWH